MYDKLIMPQDEELEKFVDGIRNKHHNEIENLETNNTKTIKESMNKIIEYHKKITQEHNALSNYFKPMDVNSNEFKNWFETKKQIEDYILLSLQLNGELDDMFKTILEVI